MNRAEVVYRLNKHCEYSCYHIYIDDDSGRSCEDYNYRGRVWVDQR